MNGFERLHATLAFGQPDRIPLGFYVVDCDTIERVIGRKTYARDKIRTQIALWEGRRDEVVESLKNDVVEFYRKIDLCDIICCKEAYCGVPQNYQPPKVRKIDATTWQDEVGRVYKVSELSNEFVCVEDPTLKGKEFTIDDFPPDQEIQPQDESVFEAFDYLLQQLGQQRFILGHSSLGAAPMLGGMEQGLCEYIANPDVVKAAIAQNVKRGNALDRQMIRPGQQGVLFEEDLGTTRASILSPQMFREFCFPALKVRTQHVKSFGQKVFIHSCGHTWELLDMFIEAGIDAYQSLQTDAGMDLSKLKDRFADRLVFWGGIAIEILVKGTPADVRKNVRDALAVAKRRGGIILGPSHSIAYGVPYDNFMALLDEFHKHAYYA
ncbi:MAG: uroporphyrinogen decarboxylase family protein [Phycisphaerae bacterium]